MAHEGDTTLRRVIANALHRLLTEEDEYAAELDRLKLTEDDALRHFHSDPAAIASAEQAFLLMRAAEVERDRHRASPPRWRIRGWRPEVQERRWLGVMAGVPVAWVAVEVTLGSGWPSLLHALGWALVVVAVTFSAAFGLPIGFWQWVQWVAKDISMTAQMPRDEWAHRRRLREDVIIPELRAWLDRQAKPSFDLELRLRGTEALTLPPGEGSLVPTAAVQQCAREVNRSMPAAVGLAGTRGVGKTTIIERAAANAFTDSGRAPMLGVRTAAPVRYDARDFVLHLHSCLCRSVLNLLADNRESAGSETRGHWSRLHRRHRLRRRLAGVVGVVLRNAVWFLVFLGLAGLAWGWRGGLGELGSRLGQFTTRIMTDPGDFFGHLGLADVAGVVASAMLLATGLGLALDLVVPLAVGAVAALRSAPRKRVVERDPAHIALRDVAAQQLRQIRFLQTHTSGWSGKVSGPMSGELGLSRSLARAEQPWTHPEVVQRLREFLGLVVEVLVPSSLSGIVVAIDELDKISDPNEAHQFLNEVKGVFGVPHCLFLVSVSDDALTAFERRGMPARDAFDSAFTTMIQVRPFTLDESRAWLAQRALGIPEPFVWLCHSVSGGLPRDLGRAAIALHDLQSKHFHLADLTRAMIRQDLDLKVRAFTHTARQTTRVAIDEPDQPQALIRMLHEATTADFPRLLALAEQVRGSQPLDTPLAALRAEVACYLLFCDTVVRAFQDDASLRRLDSVAAAFSVAGAEGAVAVLAQIRQQMAVDTTLALTVLDQFRQAFV